MFKKHPPPLYAIAVILNSAHILFIMRYQTRFVGKMCYNPQRFLDAMSWCWNLLFLTYNSDATSEVNSNLQDKCYVHIHFLEIYTANLIIIEI